MVKRHISLKGRLALARNARKASEKWHKMSHIARIRARNKRSCSWGFNKKGRYTTKRYCKKGHKYTY